MSETRITDIVPQETIDKVKELSDELQKLLANYTSVAKDLAKGIEVPVKVIGDLEKLEKLLVDKAKEAAVTNERLTAVMTEQNKVIGNTTPTIARNLAEREKANKAERETYTGYAKAKELLVQYNGTYEEHTERFVALTNQLKANKQAQADNEKALKSGRVSMIEYNETQAKLIANHRMLTQEKRTLSQIMTAEEKAAQTSETGYVHLSQTLELMKKAYKDMSEETRGNELGKELERAIQELDTHLKELAADMGEHQRNVGNYAIACQNGVVTTESLTAAMNQAAVTQQDLADQTKILEEAKQMLDKKDANYENTLASLNAKLEENKRKLTDVSDIMGKEAKSVAEAEVQNKRLTEAIKHIDLTSEGAKKKLEEMRAQIKRNNDTIGEATGTNEKFADSMLSLIGINVNFGSSLKGLDGSGNFLDGLHTKTKAFGKTLMGLLANPWVLGFLGITGLVAGFKWWYDFNKGLIEASRLTENFTGLSGDAADGVTADMQTLADTMGKGYDETIGAANTLVQQFGMSWDEAYEKMKDGIAAGADMSGNMISNIERFAPAMRDAGVSADEFMAILAETRNGIFNEDGIQNIMKAGTRLRAMTKQTEEALDAVGISAQQMQKDLADGNLSMLDAVKQVAGKLKELPENSQEAGNLMKNVFGRTASEGGALLIQSIADINTNLDKAKENMGELGEVNEKQMDAQRELNEVLMSVFKSSGTSFEKMTSQAKTFIAQGLTKIIKGCVDVVNWFIEIYNKSGLLRRQIAYIKLIFVGLWDVAKATCSSLLNFFKSLGGVIEGVLDVFNGDFSKGFEKINTSVAEGFKQFGTIVSSMVKEIGEDAADAYADAFNSRLEKMTYDLPEPEEAPEQTTTTETVEGNGTKGLSDKEKKALEKAAREELKRIQALEESKIAVMEEGHEKELAAIRLKFKKKLDEIKGEGKTQTALRLQLALQCEKEVADCELKYQQELGKINLENSLASVEKGSKAELDLKLAQLELQRAAEVKAAEKTGADVNLINEKYNRKREQLQEEFANSMAGKIQEQFGVEQIMRDKGYSDQAVALKKKYAQELAAAKGNQGKMEEAKRNYEDGMAALDEKYAVATVAATVKMYEDMLNTENLSAEDREKLRANLAKARMDLADMEAENEIKATERVTQKDREAAEKRLANQKQWMQFALDCLNEVNNTAQAILDEKIERVEAEQEANTEAGEAEQERITSLVEKQVITEEEGEARKRAAAAKTAKKDEELERKKAQLKQRQAIYDKALAVANLGMNTAMALMGLWVNPGWPAAIPLQLIVSTLGALQLATILATPIPKYAKGTDYHRGGPAIVGDGGRREVIMLNGAAWLTPDTSTLVDIPEGAAVLPSISDFFGAMPGVSVQERLPATQNVPFDDRNLRRDIAQLTQLMRRYARQRHRDASNAKYELFKLGI